MKEWGSTLDGKMRKSLSKWNLRLSNWQNFRKQKSSWTLKYCCPVTRVIEPSLGSGNTRWPARGKPSEARHPSQTREIPLMLNPQLCLWEYQISVISFLFSRWGKSKIVQVIVPTINLYSLLSKMTFFNVSASSRPKKHL